MPPGLNGSPMGTVQWYVMEKDFLSIDEAASVKATMVEHSVQMQMIGRQKALVVQAHVQVIVAGSTLYYMMTPSFILVIVGVLRAHAHTLTATCPCMQTRAS